MLPPSSDRKPFMGVLNRGRREINNRRARRQWAPRGQEGGVFAAGSRREAHAAAFFALGASLYLDAWGSNNEFRRPAGCVPFACDFGDGSDFLPVEQDIRAESNCLLILQLHEKGSPRTAYGQQEEGQREREDSRPAQVDCCQDRKSTRLNSSHLGISYA